jgi:hypothetical protein
MYVQVLNMDEDVPVSDEDVPPVRPKHYVFSDSSDNDNPTYVARTMSEPPIGYLPVSDDDIPAGRPLYYVFTDSSIWTNT